MISSSSIALGLIIAVAILGAFVVVALTFEILMVILFTITSDGDVE